MCSAERIVLTRPREVNEEFALALRKEAPHLEVVELPLSAYQQRSFAPPDFSKFDGVIVTSKAVFRFIDPDFGEAKLFMVGSDLAPENKTGALRADQLFVNAENLALELKSYPPQRFLYLRGEEISLDISTILREAGHDVDELLVYGLVDRAPERDEIDNIKGGIKAIYPVFSRSSFQSLAAFLHKNELMRLVAFLPISAKLARYIEKEMRASDLGVTILQPPEESTRLGMMRKIVSFSMRVNKDYY